MARQILELQDDELAMVVGGSTPIFTEVHVGTTPSHNYGLASDVYGQGMSFQQANAALQQFNAPTRDALYGNGNDPGAAFGTISRPGARDLPSPLDSGGNVTLAHGDGYAVNTTIPFEHPLEGSISRNLVVDLHDGGGYQALTLGRGEGGAQLATAAGGAAGYLLDGPLGGLVGAGGAQNAVHVVNPGLGQEAFSQLDAAMIAHVNDTHNPNLDGPSGILTEGKYLASAAAVGAETLAGHGPSSYGNSEQQHTVYDLAHQLNEQGPVQGYFMLSSATDGVYHVTPEGTKYYESENGKAVEKQVDEFAGVDAAVAHQAELNAHNPQPEPPGDIQLPAPSEPPALPAELAPPDNSGSGAPPAGAPEIHGDNTSGGAGADGASLAHADAGSPHADAPANAEHGDASSAHPGDSGSPVEGNISAGSSTSGSNDSGSNSGSNSGGNDSGSNSGGYDSGGYDSGGYDSGGYDGGYDGGGYDGGGYDGGGYDGGGFDGGGFD